MWPFILNCIKYTHLEENETIFVLNLNEDDKILLSPLLEGCLDLGFELLHQLSEDDHRRIFENITCEE